MRRVDGRVSRIEGAVIRDRSCSGDVERLIPPAATFAIELSYVVLIRRISRYMGNACTRLSKLWVSCRRGELLLKSE